MSVAAWLPSSIHDLPSWAVMWSLAAAIYFLCKLWTLHFAFTRGLRPSAAATFAYLLLWPGMNAVGLPQPARGAPPRRSSAGSPRWPRRCAASR